ncbi:hypothetical protein PRZ48_008006 [Zasmidium cellare]|uniref:Apple domain-containing protein n=1 Tax=Zasmidium cellare TaxID=395010 RepID=A0ABR0EEA0_ZASCE|nr:hypothetical protein PRZ48_008006 [Zasmidium cellare]
MSPSLDCPTSQAAYGYEEPTSGDQYQVQCNTVFAGSLLDVLSTRDMESCLSSCSANDDCLGAGFDEDSSSCTLYSAVIPGTSTLSPKTQFAQLRVRAVVTSGTTSSITIATFDIPLTSFPMTSAPSTAVTGQTDPITQLILPGTILSPGSTAVISGTTYSFPSSANSVLINGQPYALPTASPSYIGSPVTLPNGVVATPTTSFEGQTSTADPNAGQVTQLVLAGTTLSPGSSAVISGTTYSLPTPPSSLYINGQPYALPTASSGYIGSPLTLPNGVIATPTTAELQVSTPNLSAGQITSLVIAGTTLSPGSTAVISGASYSLPSSGGQVYIDGTSYALPTAGPSFTLPNGVVATPTSDGLQASTSNPNAGQVTHLVIAGTTLSQGSAAVISGTIYSLPISGGAVYVDGASFALPTGPGSPLTLPNGVVASPTAVPGGSPSLPPQTTGITSLVLPGTTLLPGSTAIISGTSYSFPASGGAVFIDGTPFTLPATAGSPLTLPNGIVATPTVGNGSPLTTSGAMGLILSGTTLAPGSSAVISGTTYSLATSGGVYINGQSYALPGASSDSPITLPNGVIATPTIEPANPPATNAPGIAFQTTSVANIILAGTTLAPGSTAVISGTTFSLPVSGDAIFVNGQSFPLPTGSAGSPVTLADGLVVTPTAIPNVVIGSHTFTPSGATEVVLDGTTLAPGSSAVISGTTYSLLTSGNSIYINGAPFTLSNILPGAPYTLPNGVQATPTNAPNWVIGTQTLAPGGPAVTVAGTIYSLSGSQIVVAAPSTTFTGDLYAPTGGPATTAGSSGASPGGTLPAPTGPQTTSAPGSPNSGFSLSGTATSSRRLTSSTRSNARSSTTFLTGGSVVSTTIQGITTSYATTIVAAVTADPTSALPSPTDTIADAEIGQCPGINGMISQDADDVDSRLVSCGNIYEGTVLVNATQVGNNVDGCNDLCDGIQDCVALSATRDGCNIYTYVTGMYASDKPVFSALRLRSVRNSGTTTTIEVADVESLTESMSLGNATIFSTSTFDSIVDSSSGLAGSLIGGSSIFLGSSSAAAQSASLSGLTSTPPTTGTDLSTISGQSAEASLGSSAVGASPTELDTAVSISGSSLLLPSSTGSQGSSGSTTASISSGLPLILNASVSSVSVSAPTSGGIVSTGSVPGQLSSTATLSGAASGSASTATSSFSGVQTATSARSESRFWYQLARIIFGFLVWLKSLGPSIGRHVHSTRRIFYIFCWWRSTIDQSFRVEFKLAAKSWAVATLVERADKIQPIEPYRKFDHSVSWRIAVCNQLERIGFPVCTVSTFFLDVDTERECPNRPRI